MEKESLVTATAASDFSWSKFLILAFIAAALVGAIRYEHSYYAAQAELLLFYFGIGVSSFLLAAILIVPLHLIGKRMTTGFDAPKKLVLFWGCAIAALHLIGYLLRR